MSSNIRAQQMLFYYVEQIQSYCIHIINKITIPGQSYNFTEALVKIN